MTTLGKEFTEAVPPSGPVPVSPKLPGPLERVIITSISVDALSVTMACEVELYDGLTALELVSPPGFVGVSVWAADDGAVARVSQLSTSNYMYATLSAAQSSNKGQGDHIKFDVVSNSAGSAITLDTTTAYSKVLGAASVGRFTLTPLNCTNVS